MINYLFKFSDVNTAKAALSDWCVTLDDGALVWRAKHQCGIRSIVVTDQEAIWDHSDLENSILIQDKILNTAYWLLVTIPEHAKEIVSGITALPEFYVSLPARGQVGLKITEIDSFLQAVRADNKRRVVIYCDDIDEQLTGKYPKAEQKFWDRKERAAIAFLGGDQSEATLKALQGYQSKPGRTIGQHATIIVVKAAVLAEVAMAIDVLRTSTDTAIDAANSEYQINLAMKHALASAQAELQQILYPEGQ